MTNLALRYPTHQGADPAADAGERAPRPALSFAAILARLDRWFTDVQRRQREDEAARLIADNGGLFNDEIERRIGRHLGA